MCLCECVFMCVHTQLILIQRKDQQVIQREEKRARERDRARERERARIVCVNVSVCVSALVVCYTQIRTPPHKYTEQERERERERDREKQSGTTDRKKVRRRAYVCARSCISYVVLAVYCSVLQCVPVSGWMLSTHTFAHIVGCSMFW